MMFHLYKMMLVFFQVFHFQVSSFYISDPKGSSNYSDSLGEGIQDTLDGVVSVSILKYIYKD